MAALITTLIDKVDVSESVCDQIAAILALESRNQETLAAADSQDPRLWALKVFTDHEQPWEYFQDPPATQEDSPILVNVGWDRETFDRARSNVVKLQHATAVYNVDVVACGLAHPDNSGGHIPSDRAAAIAAKRGLRWVRNILMSAQYIHLGLAGVVRDRWPVEASQMRVKGAAQHIAVARLVLEVTFSEHSPQIVTDTIETLAIKFIRASDDSILTEHGVFEEDP